MRVLGLALAGVLALTVPITGHAGGPGSVMGPANAGPAAGIVLARDDGGWSRDLGLSAPIQRPVALTNGMMEGVGLIGGRTDIMAGGGPIVGRRSPLTGSGVPAAGPSIIPSRIGEAQPAGGVIRSR